MVANPKVKQWYCPLHGVIFKCLATSQITVVLLILNKHNSQSWQTCLSLNPQQMTWTMPRNNEWYVLWCIAPHDGDQKVALLMTDK